MSRYLDPKADVVFKKIFGEHPYLLISFLNAVLPTVGELNAYDDYWDAVSTEKTLLIGRYEEGVEKGIEQGIEQGIEKGIERVAINMLKANKSLDEITHTQV